LPPADAAPRLPARAAPTPDRRLDPRGSTPLDRQGADSSFRIAQFQRCYRGSIISQGHSTQRAHGDRRVPLRRSIYQPRRQNGRARSHRNVGDKCLRNYRVSTHPHILRTELHLSSKPPPSFFPREEMPNKVLPAYCNFRRMRSRRQGDSTGQVCNPSRMERCRLLVVGCQLSVVRGPWSVVRGPLQVDFGRTRKTEHRKLARHSALCTLHTPQYAFRVAARRLRVRLVGRFPL